MASKAFLCISESESATFRSSSSDDVSNKSIVHSVKQEPLETDQRRSQPFPLYIFISMSIFAFLFTFQPSQPFLVEFFVKEKGLTATQVYQEIFPIWTYSYFGCLFLLGILSEWVNYKLAIFLGVCGNLITISILIASSNWILLQLEQFTVAIGSASFVILSSFAYHSVSEEFYQKITSSIRGSYLAGSVISAVLGQVLVSHVSLPILFYISLGTMITAGFLSLIFTNNVKKISTVESIPWKSFQAVCKELVNTYTSTVVLKWSIWGGLSLAIHHLVIMYWQSLFYETNSVQDYNGYVSAIAYSLAAVAALLPTRIEPQIETLQQILLIIFPLFGGAFLIGMSQTSLIFVDYALLVLYHCFFEFMAAITGAQIAKSMPSVRFGLVFSLNTIATMLFQTIIQFIIGKQVLNLSIHQQFLFHGCCLISLGFVYGTITATEHIKLLKLKFGCRMQTCDTEYKSIIQ